MVSSLTSYARSLDDLPQIRLDLRQLFPLPSAHEFKRLADGDLFHSSQLNPKDKMNWFSRLFFRAPAPPLHLSPMQRMTTNPDGGFVISMNKEHGLVGEMHYTDCVTEVERLKREAKHDEAIALLLRTIDATEQESAAAGSGWGVAPWYYEQLAIIYRKDGRITDEIAILERYMQQEKALGAGSQKLSERLKKAQALQKRKNA